MCRYVYRYTDVGLRDMNKQYPIHIARAPTISGKGTRHGGAYPQHHPLEAFSLGPFSELQAHLEPTFASASCRTPHAPQRTWPARL